MRLLCISDIHGHADALGAVLAAAERRGYDKVLVAGDLCFPGPQALDTWRRLTLAGAMCVQGVGDRALATIDPGSVRARSPHEAMRLQRLAEVRKELGDIILGRIRQLPPVLRLPLPNGGELVLVHGAPADPTEPITHDMSDDEVSALLGDDPADVVVCGGSHVPFDRVVAGVRIVNVGSVGEAPVGHGPSLHADAFLLEVAVPSPSVAAKSLRQQEAEWSTDDLRVEHLVVPLGKAA